MSGGGGEAGREGMVSEDAAVPNIEILEGPSKHRWGSLPVTQYGQGRRGES